MAASQAGDWLVDKATRDMGWKMARVGDKTHNLTLNSMKGAFGSLKASPLSSIPLIDTTVHRFLEGFVGLDLSKPSAITANLPFVRSPTPVVVAILSYLVVVWVWSSYIKRAGLKPRVQDPMWLQGLVILHNCFLCCLSFYMGFGILSEARRHRYSFWGNAGDDRHVEMGLYMYIFYVSKLYEFMDTAVMLLRRNLRQITFLHLYHHASISFVWWIIIHVRPTGDAYFSAVFNSSIHVAMYLYYLLAATIAKDEKRRRKYLFWGKPIFGSSYVIEGFGMKHEGAPLPSAGKFLEFFPEFKYLTMIQMLQFVSFIGQSVYGLLFPESYSKNFPRMLFFYSVSLLLFFTDFFVSKYMSTSQKSRPKPLKAE